MSVANAAAAGGGRWVERPGEGRSGATLADRVLEALAHREADDPALRNVDRRAGLRVARGAGLAARRLERAEADERHRLALLQRLGDPFNQRVDRGRGARLR